MRLSVDKEDIGYDPLVSPRSIKDITLDGYSVMHTSVITADEEQGILIRYRAWPGGEVVLAHGAWPAYDPWLGPDECTPVRVMAHGEVKIHLHDGWRMHHGKLSPIEL